MARRRPGRPGRHRRSSTCPHHGVSSHACPTPSGRALGPAPRVRRVHTTRAAHRTVRRERPLPGPGPFAQSGRMGGMVGLYAIGQLRLTRPGPLDRGVARATSRSPAQQFGGRRLSAPRAVDRPRLIGWSSLRQERRQSLTSFVAVAGTPARFPEPRGARKGGRAFRTHRSCREPAKPSSFVSARLATLEENERDAFRRVAMGRGRIPGHQACERARWGRALTGPVPSSPRSSRRERRQTSRGNLPD
jgi:hypothetical protein